MALEIDHSKQMVKGIGIHHNKTHTESNKTTINHPSIHLSIFHTINNLFYNKQTLILSQFFLYYIRNKLVLLKIGVLIPILQFPKRIVPHAPNSILKRRYSSLPFPKLDVLSIFCSAVCISAQQLPGNLPPTPTQQTLAPSIPSRFH